MRMHSHLFNNDVHQSKMYRFKEYFINEIESILNELPQKTSSIVEKVKIVDAVFTFQNSELLKKLG